MNLLDSGVIVVVDPPSLDIVPRLTDGEQNVARSAVGVERIANATQVHDAHTIYLCLNGCVGMSYENEIGFRASKELPKSGLGCVRAKSIAVILPWRCVYPKYPCTVGQFKEG